MSIADNVAFLSRLPKFADLVSQPSSSPIVEVQDFGANAGHLGMWCYVPHELLPESPLVVVLHGCTQSAAAFDQGSGWTAAAEHYGFAVLMPEQRRTNNPNLCFNWFDPQKTARGRGEALSIHRMIATMVRRHRVSTRRIFIVGLSAGGALTSAMLAAYPEVFAGGAIIAGLPFGVATNVREALSAMAAPQPRTASELGSLVRETSSHPGPWPRISVWHGSSDRTVNPINADQIVAQWRDVHGLSATAMDESVVDGQMRQIWCDKDGQAVVESYAIKGLGHGVPLGIADSDEPYGAVGPFMLEAGIASTYRIAEFFGLTETRRPQAQPAHTLFIEESTQAAAPKAVLEIGQAITRALTAVGLMK